MKKSWRFKDVGKNVAVWTVSIIGLFALASVKPLVQDFMGSKKRPSVAEIRSRTPEKFDRATSIANANLAAEAFQTGREKFGVFLNGGMTDAQHAAFAAEFNKARNFALKTDRVELNTTVPGWGDHVHDFLIPGMDGFTSSGDDVDMDRAGDKIIKFADWCKANASRLQTAK